MNITATFRDESVTIVNIDVNGHTVYVSYIDAVGDLKVSTVFYEGSGTVIASNCVI